MSLASTTAGIRKIKAISAQIVLTNVTVCWSYTAGITGH